MILDTSFSISNLVEIAIPTVGVIALVVTLRVKSAQSDSKLDDMEARLFKAQEDLAEHKLHISEAYVRRDDLDKFEDRLSRLFEGFMTGVGKRMDIVEHQLRNLDTRILSFITLKDKDRI